MVSVPVLLKLVALVETLLLDPAMVRVLVLDASALRALTPLELMVPPCKRQGGRVGGDADAGGGQIEIAAQHEGAAGKSGRR